MLYSNLGKIVLDCIIYDNEMKCKGINFVNSCFLQDIRKAQMTIISEETCQYLDCLTVYDLICLMFIQCYLKLYHVHFYHVLLCQRFLLSHPSITICSESPHFIHHSHTPSVFKYFQYLHQLFTG